MSATNSTTNLELSQFIGTDSPKWLTDYNGDMEKIDAGYGVVKAQADATDLVVSGHTSSISSLTTTTGEQTTSITNLRTDVNSNTGSINTITSLIGNGEPTTTDKTLIGAINELNSEMPAPVTSLAASAITYDNTTSGLSATTAQSAIDELVANSTTKKVFDNDIANTSTTYQFSSAIGTTKNLLIIGYRTSDSPKRQRWTTILYRSLGFNMIFEYINSTTDAISITINDVNSFDAYSSAAAIQHLEIYEI